jgi:hypothetical protein
MMRKPPDLPAAVVRAFAKDKQAYFAESDATRSPAPAQRAEAVSRPEKQYQFVLLLRRDDRYFTGGRPATAAGVGLFKHFGCPKPLAL